jgi:hypothetical protein
MQLEEQEKKAEEEKKVDSLKQQLTRAQSKVVAYEELRVMEFQMWKAKMDMGNKGSQINLNLAQVNLSELCYFYYDCYCFFFFKRGGMLECRNRSLFPN